jgi:hypothetical protein
MSQQASNGAPVSYVVLERFKIKVVYAVTTERSEVEMNNWR